jgi:hypothetical protein
MDALPSLQPETLQPEHSQPMQLLAKELIFEDLVTGLRYPYVSQFTLQML